MIKKIVQEFKEQPLSSTGAVTGIIAFFAMTVNGKSQFQDLNSGFEANAILQLFIAMLASIGVAFGFGYVASRMANSKSFPIQVTSIAFVFFAGLSANAAFTLLFSGQPNLQKLDSMNDIKMIFNVLFVGLGTFAITGSLLDEKGREDGETLVLLLILVAGVLSAAFYIPIQELLNTQTTLAVQR